MHKVILIVKGIKDHGLAFLIVFLFLILLTRFYWFQWRSSETRNNQTVNLNDRQIKILTSQVNELQDQIGLLETRIRYLEEGLDDKEREISNVKSTVSSICSNLFLNLKGWILAC